MDNLKSNVSAKRVKNLLVIDPNGNGTNNVNTEDLSISVELEVLQRGDEPVIYTDNNVTTTNVGTNEPTRISFIDGSGTEESYLTTHYTELNTNFNRDNKDLGTLGIETIDISFNTSYVPIVKIRFKDIRAKLFELGDESPYSFMFRMPYPIFYLTVKGYYGKPVQYALHLTKFNGELDNDTGSFIITCDFIGYTYAFLADLLMGLLKGIPYTKKGLNIIDGLDSFITFEELGVIVRELEQNIVKFKSENEKLKALAVYGDLNTRLENIKRQLQQQIRGLNSDFNILTDINIPESKNMAFSRETRKLTTANETTWEQSVLALVENYNSSNKIRGNSDLYALNEEYYKLDSKGVYYEKLNYRDFYRDTGTAQNADGVFFTTREVIPYEDFQSSQAITKYKFFKATGNQEIDTYLKVYYNKFIEIVKLKFNVNQNGVGQGVSYNVMDINLALERINTVQEKLNNDYNEKKKLVTKEFTDSITEFLENQETSFDATIGSFFRILCSHVDLFIQVLKSVEFDILNEINGGNRKLPAAAKGNFSEYIDEQGSTEISVRPWPEYITLEDSTDNTETDDRGYVEKWLGSDNRFSNYVEVQFIDDLYASIIKSAKKERELLKTISEDKKGWFPVNPLETWAFDKNNINPWESSSDENVEPVIKLMLQRMTLFLAFSHKNLTLEQVKEVATIEANQAYNSIINLGTKNAIVEIGADAEVWKRKILEFVGTSEEGETFGRIGDFQGLRFFFKNPLFGDSYVVYHHDIPKVYNETTRPYGFFNDFDDAFDPKGDYIPINQTSRTLKSKNNQLNNSFNRSNYDRTFVSSVISNTPQNNGNPYGTEYETFIKIIDDSEYQDTIKYDGFIPTSTDRVTKELNTEDSLISQNSDYVGGLYKTHQFTTYQHNTYGQIPLYYEFYNEDLKQKLVKRRAGNEDFVFNPTFNSNGKEFSLFGSKWYYNQTTDEARALLFLHTIPFFGFTSSDNSTTKTLLTKKTLKFFNERAGFVSIPNGWALLMGGLFYRASQDDDIITFTLPNGNSLIPNIEFVNASKDEFLIYNIISGNLGITVTNENGNGPMSFKTPLSSYSTKYQEFSDEMIKLPDSAKNVFINHFLNWVSNEWQLIKPYLEIFEIGTPNSEIDLVSFNGYTTDLGFNTLDNYDITSSNFTGNFNLNIKEGSDLADIIIEFLTDDKILINGTYRIWYGSEDRFSNFSIPFEQYNEYLKTFFDTYRSLNKENTVDPEAEIRKDIFDTDKVDDIKLSLYKNVKSIYNKWVIGVHPSMDGVITGNLFERFNFLDRAYIDISNKFKISPTGFIDYLTTKQNISFYNFIAEILRSNNFDFIPLPTFVNYNSEEDVKTIFEPIRFNDQLAYSAAGPQFICMYFGEHSNQLNIDKKEKTRKNDSFGILTKYDEKGDLIISDFSELPKDFKDTNQSIPYFLVNYADQNQSLFKKVNLNQAEFTETNESLEIIESLSKLNRNNSIGQNLFDIYNNRAYSAEVEMLGCAQIQPFMFFQVNNVPIFDGAYTIINTRHQIKANHMTTWFKGVRVRRVKTKMVDDETLYAHLLANLNEVDSEDAKLSDLEITPTDNTVNETITDEEFIEAGLDIPNSIIGTFANPLDSIYVTSDFGTRSVAGSTNHKGIDFRAQVPTDVYAVEDLVVHRVRWEPGQGSAGLYLDFRVKNQDFYVRYMHLSELSHPFFAGITPTEGMDISSGGPIGKLIKKGTVIAKTGKTGTSAPHLHFDVRKTALLGNYKNPQWFFNVNEQWAFAPNQERLHKGPLV